MSVRHSKREQRSREKRRLHRVTCGRMAACFTGGWHTSEATEAESGLYQPPPPDKNWQQGGNVRRESHPPMTHKTGRVRTGIRPRSQPPTPPHPKSGAGPDRHSLCTFAAARLGALATFWRLADSFAAAASVLTSPRGSASTSLVVGSKCVCQTKALCRLHNDRSRNLWQCRPLYCLTHTMLMAGRDQRQGGRA